MNLHWDSYLNTQYKTYFKFAAIVAICLLILGIFESLGWIAGNLCFWLSLILKNQYFDFIFAMRSFSKFVYSIYFIVSLFLLLSPSIIFYFIGGPQAMLTAFLGVMSFKFYLFFSEIFLKGGKDNSHSN